MSESGSDKEPKESEIASKLPSKTNFSEWYNEVIRTA